jgi:hypothetical protein
MSAQIPTDSEFLHPEFDAQEPGTAWLLLSVTDTQLTYVVSNREQAVLASKRFINTEGVDQLAFLKATMAAEPQLQADFAISQVILHSAEWVLTESKSVRRGMEERYLGAMFNVDESTHKLFNDAVAPFNLKTLHAAPVELVRECEDALPNVVFRHAASQLIRQCHRVQKKNDKADTLMLALYDTSMVLVLFRAGEVHLARTFAINSSKQALKIARAVSDETGCDTQNMYLLITGRSQHKAEVLAAAGRTFPNLLQADKYFPADPHLTAAGIAFDEFHDLIIP